MRPISGGFDPYGYLAYSLRRSTAVSAPARVDLRAPGDASPAADVELSIRMFADGGSISVRRHTVVDAEANGGRRTVGIDAVIR